MIQEQGGLGGGAHQLSADWRNMHLELFIWRSGHGLVDELGVDESGVDEPGHNHFSKGTIRIFQCMGGI